MASPTIKQIYGSKRKGKGGRNQENAEESEGENCNVPKTESDNSPSMKPASAKSASVKDKGIPRSKAETDRAGSSGIYPKQLKRNTKIKEKWGMLSPYLDRSELKSLLAKPFTIHYEYKSRLTANKIVEPHISYKMDHMIPDLLTEQLKNWNKRDKIHTDTRVSRSTGSKGTETRPMKLKKKIHNFDEENKSDYFATRSLFFTLGLDSLKYQSPFKRSTMESALICYMGLTKGSLAAIKELTDYYCH